MSDNRINALLHNPVGWLVDSAPDEDIAISSRVRLARNLAGERFPGHCQPEELIRVAGKMSRAIIDNDTHNLTEFDIAELGELDRMILFERRLVSKELFARPCGVRLWAAPNERLSVMVNEEDHLRSQALRPGFQLDQAWREANMLDETLSAGLDFAFDRTLGYLTSCPTNLGTGMRASVMLHLPGLVLANRIGAVVYSIAKLQLAVRGVFGEGSDNRGNLFQISNQSTLGKNEQEILDHIGNVITKLIEYEKRAREELLQKDSALLFDLIGRAYGTLRYCYKLSYEEALNSLSLLRLGVDMKMFSSVDIHLVNDLFIKVNPAHLGKISAEPSADLDAIRADMVRNKLKK